MALGEAVMLYRAVGLGGGPDVEEEEEMVCSIHALFQ